MTLFAFALVEEAICDDLIHCDCRGPLAREIRLSHSCNNPGGSSNFKYIIRSAASSTDNSDLVVARGRSYSSMLKRAQQ